MRCQFCQGQANKFPPCQECGGTGIAHCCDGICEQPQQLNPAQARYLLELVTVSPDSSLFQPNKDTSHD